MKSQIKIKSKLPNIGQNIFTEMTNFANYHNAINLAQGFPDFSSSTDLFDLVHKYMYDGKNQYAPMSGIEPLKDSIKAKFKNVYRQELHEDFKIVITVGASQAIFTTLQALVCAQDEVLYFEPAYDAYVPGIELCGGKAIPVTSTYPNFEINWADLKKNISDRTKMIIINNPGNPSGRVWNNDDFDKLYNLIKDRQIFVLSDEVYEHLVYDNKKHLSILQIPEFRDRCIAVYSFGKTFHNTGWKIGYAICHESICEEFLKVHQFNVFSVHSPTQYAFAEYLGDEKNYIHLAQFFQSKRDLFINGISTSKFKLLPTQSTYFQLLDYSNISEENDISFAKRVAKDYGVAAIPLSALYTKPLDQKVVRFCFAKKDETLKEATQRLCKI